VSVKGDALRIAKIKPNPEKPQTCRKLQQNACLSCGR